MHLLATHADAMVVGAGPSGLMFAAQLARWGFKPLIIDQNVGPTVETRALGVQARSMEIYRQMGLEEAVFARGVPSKRAAIFTEHGALGVIPMETIGAGISRYPYMFILGQDQNEAVLGADLQARGIRVEWGTAFRSVQESVDGNGLLVNLETPQGVQTRRVRYLVGADGARSAVRESLKINFTGSTYTDHKFFVADLEAEGELTPGALNLFLSRRYHVLALFPMAGARRFRLVGMMPDELVALERPTFADIQPKLREMVGQRLQLKNASWFSTYSVHHRTASEFQKGRCFLIGDAAHVHSPVGGQGMNTGLQDAYNLAWKMALVLGKRATPRLLETYADERRPNALKLIATTDRLFNYLVSKHPFARFVIDWVLPRVGPWLLKSQRLQRRFFRTFSQTALNYRGKRLSVDTVQSGIRAGDRFPWFEAEGKDVHSLLSGTAFTLCAVGTASPGLPTWADKLVNSVSLAGTSQTRSVGLKEGLYLVRPDGYVGLTTRRYADVERYLCDDIGLPSETMT